MNFKYYLEKIHVVNFTYCFMYGTLMQKSKSSAAENYTKQFGIFVDEAEIKGTLYHSGAYPGVKLDGKNIVKGEVWRVDNKHINIFDEYEGYPDLYNKQKTVATTISGKTFDVVVYTWNGSVKSPAFPVISGDWMTQKVIKDMGTSI